MIDKADAIEAHFYDIAIGLLLDAGSAHFSFDVIDEGLARTFSAAKAKIVAPISLEKEFVDQLRLALWTNHHSRFRLLGVAFVIAQDMIANTAESIIELHEIAATSRVELSTTNGKMRGIRGYGGQAPFSKIELVWAAANFYKHRRSWPANWDDAKGTAADTIAVLRNVGLQPDTRDPEIFLLEQLGGKGATTREALCDKLIIPWREALYLGYCNELQKRGLLPQLAAHIAAKTNA